MDHHCKRVKHRHHLDNLTRFQRMMSQDQEAMWPTLKVMILARMIADLIQIPVNPLLPHHHLPHHHHPHHRSPPLLRLPHTHPLPIKVGGEMSPRGSGVENIISGQSRSAS
ncbi:unnamed protein product [Trichogramma brassicae]|uniref:Uncharacterized protein n=1 Tax=Trichogramma brassicae TaxID=86971 RepID=A0A6H5IK34_9HYME|nr:unnamed protein product [Trichogramma brassicae]